MNRHRRGLARPTMWLLLAALLLGTFSPLVSSGGALAEDSPVVDETDVADEPKITETDPTAAPTDIPVEPTNVPIDPTDVPVEPTDEPVEPTTVPTDPGPEPSAEPSVSPTDEPSAVASATPTGESMPLMGIQAIPTTGTITKTASNVNPAPGEAVTFTIAISGEAEGGTDLTLDDVLPAGLTLTGVTPTGENLLVGDNQGGANAVSLLLTVQGDGDYGLTVTVESVVNDGVARDTIITNTACVDVSAGPQDTCASAAVTVQRPLTYLDRLLQWLVALLIGILGGL